MCFHSFKEARSCCTAALAKFRILAAKVPPYASQTLLKISTASKLNCFNKVNFYPKRSGRVSVKSFREITGIQGYILKLPQITCGKSQYKTLKSIKKRNILIVLEKLHMTRRWKRWMGDL